MKLMKFKVKNPEHSAEIQKALFKAGYRWPSSGMSVVYKNSSYLYTGTDFIAHGSQQDYFDNSCLQEMFVVNGEIVEKEPSKNFNVGDKVRVLQGSPVPGLDWNREMNDYVGGMYEIEQIDVCGHNGRVLVMLKDVVSAFGFPWCFDPTWLELAQEPVTEKRVTLDEMLDNIAKSTPGATQTITQVVADTPPVGLRPKSVVDQERIIEILEAMHRYVKVGKEVPYEWQQELAEFFDGGNYCVAK